MSQPGRPRGSTTAVDERGLQRLLARLGKNLRALRKERALTQEQMAEIVGLDARYFQRVETGHVNLTLGLLAKVAGRLKVDASSLLASAPTTTSRARANSTRPKP